MDHLRNHFTVGARAFGVLLLAGVLLAACGDDDDDVDLGDDGDQTPAVELTATIADDGDDDATATTEDAGMDATPTTDDDDDATATEDDDDDATAAGDDDSATATDDDQAQAGTPTDDDATSDATSTTDSGATQATATESRDTTATAPASGTSSDAGSDRPGRMAEIGERISLDDDVSITVESVEEAMGLPGVIEPESGNRFIAIELTVENADDDPIEALDLFTGMRVETEDRTFFEIDPLVTATLLADRDVFEQDINQGESVTASVAFEVPADDDNLFLVIDDDLDDDFDIDDDDDDDDDDDLIFVDLSEALSQ